MPRSEFRGWAEGVIFRGWLTIPRRRSARVLQHLLSHSMQPDRGVLGERVTGRDQGQPADLVLELR